MNRETQILRVLANSSLPMDERTALVAELGAIRRSAANRHQASREIDFDAAAAHLTPVQPYVRHTAETDWLGKVAAHGKTASEVHAAAKAEATQWFSSIHPQIVADRREFAVQASGMARLLMGKFGDDADSAVASFLQQAGHLAGYRIAECSDDDGEDGDSNGDPDKQDPPMKGEDGELEDDDDYDGPRRESRRRTARLINVWDLKPGDVLLRGEGASPDPENDTVQKVDGVNGMWIIDFTNGQSTPPLGNGQVYVASRRRSAFDGVPSITKSMYSGEEYPCALCGKPATKYAYQEGARASGYFTCDDCLQFFSPGRTVVEASLRSAAEGQTCSVCGDKIAQTDGSWHHDNGEKHDHEAKPKSSKTAASPDFKSYPKNRAPGQEWSTTCSVCGKTETGTDYYNGWPSQKAFGDHLFCGLDPGADYKQDLAIDRFSSLRTAADGATSYCRLCGKQLEQMENIWYALKASPTQRDVGPHYCVPARTNQARPGEFGPDGKLAPGTPGGEGGQYDAPAGTIFDGGANPIKVGSHRTAAECSCARNADGTVTTMLCPVHADNDPCETIASVTGGRRKGTIVGGVCSNCGWRRSTDEMRSRMLASRRTAEQSYVNSYGLDENKIVRGMKVYVEGEVEATVLYIGFDDIMNHLGINPEELGYRMYGNSFPVAVSSPDGPRIVQFDALATRRGPVSASLRSAVSQDVAAASGFLGKLNEGDPVTVIIDGQEKQMAVSRRLSSGDPGGFGAMESSYVIVSFGPGRYSTNITVRQQAAKAPGMPYIKDGSRTAAVGPEFWDRVYNGDGVSNGVPEDLFPEGGVPLHGDLTPEQEAWLKKRSNIQSKAVLDGMLYYDALYSAVGKYDTSPAYRDAIRKALEKADEQLVIEMWNAYIHASDDVNPSDLSMADVAARAVVDVLLKRNMRDASRRQSGGMVPDANSSADTTDDGKTDDEYTDESDFDVVDDFDEGRYGSRRQGSVGSVVRDSGWSAPLKSLEGESVPRTRTMSVDALGQGKGNLMVTLSFFWPDYEVRVDPYPGKVVAKGQTSTLGIIESAAMDWIEKNVTPEWYSAEREKGIAAYSARRASEVPSPSTESQNGGNYTASRRQATPDGFWESIHAQYEALKSAQSADDVFAILKPIPGTSTGEGFFEGSGGDEQVYDALREAGWKVVWAEADYYWCMRAPNGDLITYTEGDVDRGNGGRISSRRQALEGPSPQSQNGYGESSLPDVTVPGATEDTNLGWIDDPEEAYAPASGGVGPFDARRAAAITNTAGEQFHVVNGRLVRVGEEMIVGPSDAPENTNLGWIAEGDPDAQDEFAFEPPDFPIANEAGLRTAAYDLYDIETGEKIGPATQDQIDASLAAGDEGGIVIDSDGDVVDDGSWGAQQPGSRKVYVASLKTAMPNPVDLGISVGDIFYSSWGYDQTNVDFYQVVGLTGASVKVRQVAQRTVTSGGAGGDKVVAVPDHFVGEVMTKRIQNYSDRPSFSLNSYSSAWLWDGTPKYQTGFGFGH